MQKLSLEWALGLEQWLSGEQMEVEAGQEAWWPRGFLVWRNIGDGLGEIQRGWCQSRGQLW